MVLVSQTPFPPVSQFGLPEFGEHERRVFDGITFKNTFFVVDGRQTLRLQFHELVHTVQWARLGVDRFLLAYGFGLLKYGYEQSPLEKMAYGLEQPVPVDELFKGRDVSRRKSERKKYYPHPFIAIWQEVFGGERNLCVSRFQCPAPC
jgi:hypothetical protein